MKAMNEKIANIIADCRRQQARYGNPANDVGCMNTGSQSGISEIYRRLADALEALSETQRPTTNRFRPARKRR